MSNSYFQFKQFAIQQDRCTMKVTTDGCLFGAWITKEINKEEFISNNALDIGTGTGLLSLMIAQKTNFNIDAVEIDKESYEQAKENISSSPWNDRINVLHGDARNFNFSKQYDIIFSNPPFYENELKSEDARRNIALHSDELTLDDLLRVINNNLSSSGIFFLLLPYKRKDELRKIFQKYKFSLKKIIFVRQSVEHDYFRLMILGKRETGELIETSFNEISIWDKNKNYPKEFIMLLKDYYLNL